jgi:hypothetical protein
MKLYRFTDKINFWEDVQNEKERKEERFSIIDLVKKK